MGHYGAIGEGLGGSKPLIMEFDGAFEYGRFNATDVSIVKIDLLRNLISIWNILF